MSPADLFPTIQPWVESLPNHWPGNVIKPQFASWEVLHILSLIILGGATIILNLRLIGVGMMEEAPSEVQRNLRLWLNVGVIGIVVSGVLIGLANAERLYNSTAFTVKMLALVAGVIFSYGVSGPVARADGEVSRSAKIWFLVGLAVFLLGLWIFSTSKLINPGVFHIMTAAALIVIFALRGRARWIFVGGLVVIEVAQWLGSHVIVHQDDFEHLDPTNKAFACVFAAWILGFAAYQLFGKRGAEGRPLPQVMGYMSILVWIMAAAAGRWIAFA